MKLQYLFLFIIAGCFITVSLSAETEMTKTTEVTKTVEMTKTVEIIKDEFFISVPEGRISVVRYSTPESKNKIPLLVLHGGPGLAHNYLEPLSLLAKERPVIFYDQMGVGNSKPFNQHFKMWTLDYFVDELKSILDKLELDSVYLLGHSWGAALGLEYVFRYPDPRIKGIVLASPLLSTFHWVKDANLLLKELPAETLNLILEFEETNNTNSEEYKKAKLEFNKKHVCRLDPWPKEITTCPKNTKIYETMWGTAEFSMSGNLENFNRLKDLNKLTLPILFTGGRFDEARPETLELARSLTRNAELKIFENSAHMPHLEETQNYLQALQMFFNKNEGKP